MPATFSNRRIAFIAITVLILDQFTKWIVNVHLAVGQEIVLLDGFFKFVHAENTGAAWSMFAGRNSILAIVAIVALLVLFWNRHHFDAHTVAGQISLGLIFGGITGNLIDRIVAHHVVDFIYFYLQQRDGGIISFPAFNIADSAICVGVGLLFWHSWRKEHHPPASASPA